MATWLQVCVSAGRVCPRIVDHIALHVITEIEAWRPDRKCVFVCAGQSVDHHFLSSYYDAMLSIILEQFRSKGFADGMDGIIRLAESSDFIAVSPSTPCPQWLLVISGSCLWVHDKNARQPGWSVCCRMSTSVALCLSLCEYISAAPPCSKS